jgi:lysozyme
MKKAILVILILLLIMPISALSQSSAIDKAKKVIKKYEGCALKAYKCPAGVQTIGYGNTKYAAPGKVISWDIADLYLSEDIKRFEKYVNKTVRLDLEPHKKAALISFTFNLGYIIKGNLRNNIIFGSAKSAAENIKLYNKARVKGKLTPLNGLTKRRNTEATLYLEDLIIFY